jgi:ABC-2 type transport system permease protein
MNLVIFRLTLRELAGQKRIILMLLLAAVPVLLALVYGLGDREDPYDFTANMLESVDVTVVLPLICLVLGASALGSEIDDGTVVYILAKPLPRLHIVLAKFAAAALISGALVVTATVLAGTIALGSEPGEGLTLGFGIAVAVGAIAYTAVFVLLSIVTSRALLFGLGYVFIWEGLVTNLFGAMAYVSIRQYTLGIADAITSVDRFQTDFEADLSAAEALPLVALVTFGALYFATRRLETLELGEAE